jgi:nucleoside-diphosphate-sugar epimerase
MASMKKLLIAGFGDIARRAAPRLEARYTVQALSRRRGFDLDRPGTLAPLLAPDAVLHCAPPPGSGASDTRTTHLLAALAKGRILPARVVYVSTSGVYGDCGGARVDESRIVQPQTDRARRRVDAERQLALWCSGHGVALVILRVPGIYAADRLPLERLRRGTPVLRPEDDVYTNHIHADDLAAIVVRSLEGGAPGGTYNASDDSDICMGDWLDLVAERSGLPRPPRIARSEARERIAPELLSFMSESRRLANRRMKEGLGVHLRYATVFEGVPHREKAA